MTNATKHIAITIAGREATCTPAPTCNLDLLQYGEQSYQIRNRKGSWRTIQQPQYRTDEDGSLVIPAGSVPRIETALRSHGYEVCVSDRTALPAVIYDYDHTFLDQLNAQQRLRGEAIVSHRQFVMLAPQQAGLETMGFVTRLFPSARIFIALPTNDADEFNCVLMAMANFVGGDIGRAVGLGCYCAQRVAIGTYAQFASSNPEEWQIVLFPDLSQGVSKLLMDGARPYENHRMYGFLGGNGRLSWRDLLRVEVLAGPLMCDSPSADFSPTVTAVFCSSSSRPIRLPATPLERKRVGIWNNQDRNRLIAEVAEAFASADQQVLSSHFVVGEDDELLTAGPRSVAILVESREHGRELALLLPGWQLVALPESASWQYPCSTLRGRIITLPAANKLGDVAADVLIRADGGETGVRPPVAPQRLDLAARRRFLVDFVDDFASSFLVAAHSRALAYRSQGLSIRCPEWLLRLDPTEVNARASSVHRPRRRQRPRSA